MIIKTVVPMEGGKTLEAKTVTGTARKSAPIPSTCSVTYSEHSTLRLIDSGLGHKTRRCRKVTYPESYMRIVV